MSTRPSAWNVPASKVAKNAHNPIRQIVDKLKIDPNAQKDLISLALGIFPALTHLLSCCRCQQF
jgi:tyrosine aminotransferase